MLFCNYFNEVFVKEGNWNTDTEINHTEDINVEITEKKSKKKCCMQSKRTSHLVQTEYILSSSTAQQRKWPDQSLRSLTSHLPKVYCRTTGKGLIFHPFTRRVPDGNYRPVSLTSVICKVLEAMIKDSMLQSLEESQWLTPKQHGFVSGRSCMSNLLEAFDNWTELLDEGHGNDIIYLDTVPHKRLFDEGLASRHWR